MRATRATRAAVQWTRRVLRAPSRRGRAAWRSPTHRDGDAALLRRREPPPVGAATANTNWSSRTTTATPERDPRARAAGRLSRDAHRARPAVTALGQPRVRRGGPRATQELDIVWATPGDWCRFVLRTTAPRSTTPRRIGATASSRRSAPENRRPRTACAANGPGATRVQGFMAHSPATGVDPARPSKSFSVWAVRNWNPGLIWRISLTTRSRSSFASVDGAFCQAW